MKQTLQPTCLSVCLGGYESVCMRERKKEGGEKERERRRQDTLLFFMNHSRVHNHRQDQAGYNF